MSRLQRELRLEVWLRYPLDHPHCLDFDQIHHNHGKVLNMYQLQRQSTDHPILDRESALKSELRNTSPTR
jgi:hypothetical protein